MVKIPMEVMLPNGDIDNRPERALEIWENVFASLYSGDCIPPIFDDSALANVGNNKDILEKKMDQKGYSVNQLLNGDLTLEEVTKAIVKSKNGEATGVEGLYNEILKCPKILPVLFCFFRTCFHYGIIPSMWYKSIIKPNPQVCRK